MTPSLPRRITPSGVTEPMPGPGLRDLPRLAIDHLRHGEQAVDRLFDRYGDVFRVKVRIMPGTTATVLMRDPSLVRPLFTASAEEIDSTHANRLLQHLYGERSLFLIDGPEHRRLRRVLLPPLRDTALEAWRDTIVEVARTSAQRLPVGEPVQLHPRMLADSLDIILRIALGVTEDERPRWVPPMTELLERALSQDVAMRMVARRILRRSPVPPRLAQVLEECEALIYAEIARRRAEPDGERHDLLDLLMQAEGEPLTDLELRDQVMTMLIAGHETSATAVSWAIERLLRHPEALARAIEEARSGDGDAYAEAVVLEALRLRPPIAVVGRVTRQTFQLGEWVLPPGTLVSPYIRGIHESAALYDDPKAFRPERFLDATPPPFTLVPFGGGLHRCLGDRLAVFQSKLFLQTYLREVDLEAASRTDERIKRKAIAYVPGDGTRVRVRGRVSSARVDSSTIHA
jgi:cytochrome P450 family 135